MAIHEMKLNPASFSAVRSGKKIIESRLYDEKRQQIKIGDQIVFRKMDDPDETIIVSVVGLLRYAAFSDLFHDFPASYFGGESKNALETHIRQFYSKEDEETFGVLGIRIAA
jgi:ASC-1-like (ASCH) protein